MIKEKLMSALKDAAEYYNGGMSADSSVAKAAEAADFNTDQAHRLVEMFNTAIALRQEKDASDPTGSCELASKDVVSNILIGKCCEKKEASCSDKDYSFYSTTPERTSPSLEARESGRKRNVKAASIEGSRIEPELDVSQRSLYKIIEEKIAMLKSAGSAADDVVRNIMLDTSDGARRIARRIESSVFGQEMADMFKAACECKKAVDLVSEYSSLVSSSDGGKYSRAEVFDPSPIEDLLKIAEDIERGLSSVSDYEKKRDFYLSKAAEASNEMLEAVGLAGTNEDASGTKSIADMVSIPSKEASDKKKDCPDEGEANLCVKMASILKESGVTSQAISDIVSELEKEAAGAPRMMMTIPMPTIEEAHGALSKFPGVDNEKKIVNNVRRSVILADLMSNDPIIRDADPDAVVEAYKTMIMTSPRVSLDKSQVRSFLRSAVNSIAISPSDAKVIADVDKGMSFSNVDSLNRMTLLDSSMKDSNV